MRNKNNSTLNSSKPNDLTNSIQTFYSTTKACLALAKINTDYEHIHKIKCFKDIFSRNASVFTLSAHFSEE